VGKLSEGIRRTTVFLLAVFLWLHALFILNVQSNLTSKFAYYLHFTTSETVLLALLVICSLASGPGFWRPFLSLLYIYAFPFVLFWKLLRWSFLGFRWLHRWFKAQASLSIDTPLVLEQKESPTNLASSPGKPEEIGGKERTKEVVDLLLRPFRKFTFLWCILLLDSTHIQIVWACLVVVILHLARKMFGLLSAMLFFDPYLNKAIARLFEVIERAANTIDAFTPDTNPSSELKNDLNQINVWLKITDFLRDEYLVSRWAWVLGIISFGLIYVYIALLFSFVYVGIARVSGISYPWASSLVASLFIPLFATELPKTFSLRLVGGIHCVLVLTVGISTFFSFLQRRLFAIRTAATVVNDKLIDEAFQKKVTIVGTKLAESPAKSPQGQMEIQVGKQAKAGRKKKAR
jgi:hypothetical protein